MLTPKQEAFAAGIASGLSQAEAYRRAFPGSQKWRDDAVYSRASTLAANAKVQQRVKELRSKAAQANEVTVADIVAELKLVAFGRATDVMTWTEGGVKLIPSDQLSAEKAALVAEVKETVSATGGTLSLKTHSKLEALKLLGEYLGMFKKVAELTGPNGRPLVPDAPKGVLVVPGVLDEAAWEQMMAKRSSKGDEA